jgi:hypothetical protein
MPIVTVWAVVAVPESIGKMLAVDRHNSEMELWAGRGGLKRRYSLRCPHLVPRHETLRRCSLLSSLSLSTLLQRDAGILYEPNDDYGGASIPSLSVA